MVKKKKLWGLGPVKYNHKGKRKFLSSRPRRRASRKLKAGIQS